MELELRQQMLPYLAPTTAVQLPLEESAECIVPDASPDVERVLDSSGVVLLRSKECRDGSCSAGGSVRVWVLYLAEGEREPRRLELSIPFSARVEHPALSGESVLSFRGNLRSVDTRLVNPRKVNVRAALTATLEAWSPAQLHWSSGTAHEGVECRVERRRVVVPVAAAEKPFVVSDELELPAGQPPLRQLLRWSVVPELTDWRLVGEKAVFKGEAALDILYCGETGSVERWQTRLPFSQYMDLPGATEEDSLRVVPVLTGAELEPDGFGSRLQLTLHCNAQCLAESSREMELLTDLYSLTERAEPVLQHQTVETLLDRQRIRQDCRENIACPGRPIAARVMPEMPTQRREGDSLSIGTEAQLHLLYLDEDDALQTVSRRVRLECRTALAEGCACRPEVQLGGEVQCMPAAEGAELRFVLWVELPCYGNADMGSVASCAMTPLPESSPKPSLIVRRVREGESAWSIAKACRSTVAAIENLNGELSPGMLLLVPRG